MSPIVAITNGRKCGPFHFSLCYGFRCRNSGQNTIYEVQKAARTALGDRKPKCDPEDEEKAALVRKAGDPRASRRLLTLA